MALVVPLQAAMRETSVILSASSCEPWVALLCSMFALGCSIGWRTAMTQTQC